MTHTEAPLIRIALPSKGHLYEGSIALFRRAGYTIRRPSERQYEASISGHSHFHVVFMRPADIVSQVKEGRCQLGVTGMDVFAEAQHEADAGHVVISDLGFGGCRLSVAVPESWIDVAHVLDLVDLTTEFKSAGKSFRVSTKYAHLVRRAFRTWGIYHYQVVASDGALELHPSLGIADIIVDLTSSGATLKDNRLKEIEGGTVLESAACLVGNEPWLQCAVSEKPVGELALLLDALDGVRTAEGWLHFEVVGGPVAPRSAMQTASDAAEELLRLGAQHICRGQVWDEQNKEAWRLTGLIRDTTLSAGRRKLAALGALRMVAMPARAVFNSNDLSTFDALRNSLGFQS
jgi:ATP phosphoribosyltransferase